MKKRDPLSAAATPRRMARALRTASCVLWLALLALGGCDREASGASEPSQPAGAQAVAPARAPAGARVAAAGGAVTRSGAGGAAAGVLGPGARTLRILTYNVMPQLHDVARLPALFAAIEAADADVIALQEVTPWLLAALRGQPWAKRYAGPPGFAQPVYGLYILSRLAYEAADAHPLRSLMERGVMIARVRVAGGSLTVATVHLDSPLELGRVRAAQLRAVRGMLRGVGESVLLGDFNFGDGEQPDTHALPRDHVDLWTALRPDEPGWTWDMEANPLARDGAFAGEQSRRLDRILVRAWRWRPWAVEVVGDEAVAGQPGLFASDHFGVLGVVRLDPGAEAPAPGAWPPDDSEGMDDPHHDH